MVTIPHTLLVSSEEKALREKSRMRQVEYSNRVLRKPDIYKPGEVVYLQDEEGHWTVRETIISQRTHQGMSTALYLLKNQRAGDLLCATNTILGDSTMDEVS